MKWVEPRKHETKIERLRAEIAQMEKYEDMEGMSLVQLIASKKDGVLYIPVLARVAGRVTAAILLQQIIQYARGKEYRTFYKFIAPCNHDMYIIGDSWLERLLFSRREFDTAIRAIGTKITRGVSKKSVWEGMETQNLVLYWTDSCRVTHYLLNLPLLAMKVRIELKKIRKEKLQAKKDRLKFLEKKELTNSD